MGEAQDVFTTSDRHAAEVLRVLEKARGNLATPDVPTLRATVGPAGNEVALRLVLSTADPAAEAAAESLVASARALSRRCREAPTETIVVAATQKLADVQRAEERGLRELSESVQALRRQTEVRGEVKAIIERRLRVRRFNSPLVFHRVCKGRPGQPITDFWEVWKEALQKAGLPAGRLFHDLRRSAVRTLIRAGVDETTAMKVSGHKTRSMLLRYNIVTGRETADALLRADACLSTQPTRVENERDN